MERRNRQSLDMNDEGYSYLMPGDNLFMPTFTNIELPWQDTAKYETYTIVSLPKVEWPEALTEL